MRKLIIVDDNPDDIEITRMVLEEKGWVDVQVDAYKQSEKALISLQETKDLPVLILLDMNIPGMGGITFLKRIRTDPRLRSIPVIVATSSSFAMDEKLALDTGADFFLYKDLDMDRFGGKLDAIMKRIMM